MAGGEDLLERDPGSAPAGAPGAEARDRVAGGGTRAGSGGDKMGDRPTMAGDGEALAALDGAEQLGKVGLGLGRLDLAYEFNLSF